MRTSLLLALLAAPLAAQTAAVKHPDIAGSWVLDAAKSTTDGPLPLPTSATYLVNTHGDTISVVIKSSDAGGDMAMTKTFATDGYSWNNTMTYQGNSLALSSVVKWTGAVLSIATSIDFGGTPVTQSETWTVAADGKTLTTVTTTSAGGAYYAAQTLVFNKKP